MGSEMCMRDRYVSTVVLYCDTVLYCTVLYCIALLFGTVLYCTALPCTVLYYFTILLCSAAVLRHSRLLSFRRHTHVIDYTIFDETSFYSVVMALLCCKRSIYVCIWGIRPTIMGSENRKQNRISLHRTETREQCRR